MNIRTFLRGGYRDATEPTTVISGQLRLGVWLPEAWQAESRPAHPEAEVALTSDDRPVSPAATGSARTGADGQTEAPSAAPSAGRGRSSGGRLSGGPARRPSTQAILDRANKEGR
jgi:hypothetical protein